MTPPETLILGLIAAIVGHAVVMFFRSPKEVLKALEAKIEEIEENHNTLDRMLTRHDEVVKNLVAAIERLTQRIDRLEPYFGKPDGRRRG